MFMVFNHAQRKNWMLLLTLITGENEISSSIQTCNIGHSYRIGGLNFVFYISLSID